MAKLSWITKEELKDKKQIINNKNTDRKLKAIEQSIAELSVQIAMQNLK